MKALDLIKKDLNNLDKVINVYTSYLDEVEDLLRISGKPISVVNAEQSGWANYYHEKEVEVKYIKEYVKLVLDSTKGKLWQKYTEKMDRVLTPKDKEEYIKHDPVYLDMLEKYLKVEELHDQFKRVVSSYDKLGYALNNLTRLIIASNDDWLIP
jgi:hypothetical protein